MEKRKCWKKRKMMKKSLNQAHPPNTHTHYTTPPRTLPYTLRYARKERILRAQAAVHLLLLLLQLYTSSLRLHYTHTRWLLCFPTSHLPSLLLDYWLALKTKKRFFKSWNTSAHEMRWTSLSCDFSVVYSTRPICRPLIRDKTYTEPSSLVEKYSPPTNFPNFLPAIGPPNTLPRPSHTKSWVLWWLSVVHFNF